MCVEFMVTHVPLTNVSTGCSGVRGGIFTNHIKILHVMHTTAKKKIEEMALGKQKTMHTNESCHTCEWVCGIEKKTYINRKPCWWLLRIELLRVYVDVVIWYGVATISRMLKNIGLFCKRALQKRPVFCKETCIFKHPTHRSHPICGMLSISMWYDVNFYAECLRGKT